MRQSSRSGGSPPGDSPLSPAIAPMGATAYALEPGDATGEGALAIVRSPRSGGTVARQAVAPLSRLSARCERRRIGNDGARRDLLDVPGRPASV